MVLTVAEVLLSSFDSSMVLSGSTTAVFVNGPVAGAWTCRVIEPFWPWLTAPPVQSTTVGAPEVVQVNRLVPSIELTTTPVGRVSRTVMPVAFTAPRLLTVRM